MIALVAGLVVALIVFYFEHVLPGDPCLGEGRTAAVFYQRCLHSLHLDQPLPLQFLDYLGFIFSGAVSPELESRGLTSLLVGGLALAFAAAAGVSWGAYSAARRLELRGHLANAATAAALGIPSFVIAGGMTYFATTVLGNLTGSVIYYTPGWGEPYQVVLPVIALGLWPAGFIARLTRGGILEALRQEYVATARAKGLSERRLLTVHVLRNGILPALSQPGPVVMATIGGSIVVENIFHIPGLGSAAVPAIIDRNYEWAVESAFYYTVLVGLFNAAADLAMLAADPRIRLATRR